MNTRLRAIACLCASSAAAAAQEPPPPPAERGHCIELAYPRDKERVVAKVDGQPITLDELVTHIEECHHPGFRRYLLGPEGKGSPDGARMLRSDLIAPWVRQFADVMALRAENRTRGPSDPDQVKRAQDAALEASFKAYFDAYVADLKSRDLPTDISQQRFHRLLADYQLRHGLACELQGWLDFLAPERDWTNQQLNDYFQANARVFGGSVTLAHILVRNRDAGTGILLAPEPLERAQARLQAVKSRLRPDGSNFEDLAREFSEDTVTAPGGGVLEGVDRFDQRLPAVLCRTAWGLKDGEVSDTVESQYGWHLVKRVEHVQKRYMLFTEGALPTVREAKRRNEQEDVLFAARARFKVQLLL
jgi:hypothetical protein